MQNTFSSISEVPIIYSSLNNVKKSKVQSLFWDSSNHLTVIPKARQKISWANSKFCISMTDIKAVFRSPLLFIFVDCTKLLSPELVSLPVSSFPQQISHGSDISNILRSPRQLQLYTFLFQWLRSTHDLLGSSMGLGHFSIPAFCSTLVSDWLQSTAAAVISGHPMGQASPIQ